jgi:hypothetical protein
MSKAIDRLNGKRLSRHAHLMEVEKQLQAIADAWADTTYRQRAVIRGTAGHFVAQIEDALQEDEVVPDYKAAMPHIKSLITVGLRQAMATSGLRSGHDLDSYEAQIKQHFLAAMDAALQEDTND